MAYFTGMPYLEFNINTDIVFPNSGIPIFLSKYIKSMLDNSCFPKKFLLYSPNLFVNSYEKKFYENVNNLEVVAFVNSDKCDQTHEEIYQEIKECYSKLSIKTRFVFIKIFNQANIFFFLYRSLDISSFSLAPHESRKFAFETTTSITPNYFQVNLFLDYFIILFIFRLVISAIA